jgi:hypothetical protein
MRALLAIVGVLTAVAGLAVFGDQVFHWLRDGIWTPIPFSELWFALGGHAPDLLSPGAIGGILAQLLLQPLALVLVMFGGLLAWFGTGGRLRPWQRL